MFRCFLFFGYSRFDQFGIPENRLQEAKIFLKLLCFLLLATEINIFKAEKDRYKYSSTKPI